jgi:hypothetical protein
MGMEAGCTTRPYENISFREACKHIAEANSRMQSPAQTVRTIPCRKRMKIQLVLAAFKRSTEIKP